MSLDLLSFALRCRLASGIGLVLWAAVACDDPEVPVRQHGSRAERRPAVPIVPISHRCSSPRIAIAASGGGYRAALALTATFGALEDAHLLKNIDELSCVSGSCIPAALFVQNRVQNPRGAEWKVTEEQIANFVSRIELPRTVIAAELATAGGAMADELFRCVKEAMPTYKLKEVFFTCIHRVGQAAGKSGLDEAIPMLVDDNLAEPQACAASAEQTFGAAAAQLLVRCATDDGAASQIRSTICDAKCKPANGGAPGQVFEALLLRLIGRQRFDQIGSTDSPTPTLIVNATDTLDGSLWTVSRFGEGRIGTAGSGPVWHALPRNDDAPAIATAAAASACHPAFCRPMRIPGSAVLSSRTTLTDGGVFDNTGFLGLKHQTARWRMPYDQLILVDSRPTRAQTADAAGEQTRLGTILGVHELMLEQMTDRTIQAAVDHEKLQGHEAPVILTLRSGATPMIARLDTDMRPLEREKVAQILRESRQAFGARLGASPCFAAATSSR